MHQIHFRPGNCIGRPAVAVARIAVDCPAGSLQDAGRLRAVPAKEGGEGWKAVYHL